MSARDELVFVPLGGVGEIGMNMAAYGFGPERRRKWIVVDCGVSFGRPEHMGIELIMADPAFLEERADDVLALILTHSHEDHYGAVLDLWPSFDRPVYATRFTAAMLAAKRAADGIADNVTIVPMRPGEPFTLGPFTVEPVNVTHSIPESCALLITTPLGRLVHTGDWKLDPRPVGAPPTDAGRLEAFGREEGPLALVCDSTNAMRDGESISEHQVGATLAALIAEAPHRVAITTFASNVGRVISIARAAQQAGRSVVLSGRALHRIVTIAREMGMLEGIPPFLDQEAFKELPRDKVVLLCTGSQGEARAAIARIAREEHPAIALNAGDRVIFSSWAIPGNEREVIDIQNRLIDRGVDVITQRDAPLVHTTGHPRRDELRRLYGWLRPDVLVPVHGEAAHLEAHARLGKAEGIPTVISARNGDMVRLQPDPMVFPGEVRTGTLYLDGNILCAPDESGVRGRRRLAYGGTIAISLCIDARGTVRDGPDFAIEGLPVVEDDEDDVETLVRRVVAGTLKSIPPKRRNDADTVGSAIQRAVRGEVAAWWGKKPNVTVFVHRV